MNFDQEEWRKFYIRDTPTWVMLPWQSRCVLPLLLKKVDKSGKMELGKYGVPGLAAMLLLPLEVVEPGLSGLINDGIIHLDDAGVLFWPKFREGQERIDNAERQRRYRDRQAELKREADSVTSVTERYETLLPLRVTTERNASLDQIREDQIRSDPPLPPAGGGENDREEVTSVNVSAKPANVRYAEAYARGISDFTKTPCTTPTDNPDLGALAKVVLAHSEGRRGEELLEWVRASAFAYRRAHDNQEPRFCSHYRPRHWMEWMNTSGWRLKPPKPPRQSHVRPVDEEAPMSQQELMAASSGVLSALVGGIGKP